jgi:uncharacterized protein YecE (DUF72 family)
MRAGEIRIGISGWTYRPWRGSFFPKGLIQKDELAYAAGTFRSIEVNGTFYGLQKPAAFARWAETVPEDFVFSVKAPRFITHIRRLNDVAVPVANFLASGVLRLGAKLGPILWQFPASFRYDPERMAAFLALLPHDTEAGVALARRHDAKLDGRDWVKTDATRPLRHAIEIRHESFACGEFVRMLRTHNVALVCADTVEWPRLMDATADFIYCRLHGSEQLYASGYHDAALDEWAARVRAWRAGGVPKDAELLAPAATRVRRDVFVYFDNDMKVKAPFDAQALMRRLHVTAARAA